MTRMCLLIVFAMAWIAGGIGANAQTLAASGPVLTWQGHFSSQDAEEVLQYRDGDLYLSSKAVPDWTFIGSTTGFNVGKPGLYVGRLDGSERSSVAFYDASALTWYWGTVQDAQLYWSQVNEIVGDQPVFRVGDGPTLFPVASAPAPNVEVAGSAAKTTSAAKLTPPSGVNRPGGTANASIAPAPIVSYPLRGDQKTNLARSQHMQTNIMMFANGELYGTTRVWEDTLLAGFHGGVIVVLYDEYNRPLWKLGKKVVIGVTGRLWGHSDVTANWTDQVPPALLPYVKRYAIVHAWAPNYWTFFNEFKPLIDFAVNLIKTFSK